MTDGGADYEELLPDGRQTRHEWFWLFAGSSVGAMTSGVAVIWAGVPPWATIATGVVVFLCCLAVQHHYGI